MAIYNGRILMRKGNEADFDASKLMSGEWAVSLDAGIVRICLEAGKVIRMATYEAFEEDMKQIEAILLECQSIEEAVRRINTEVSEKLNACAEYVQQAKGYSEQAKTSEANSKSYMQSAKTSEENAKVSETNAKASENSAKEYENSAKLTEERAREVFESIPEDYSTISNDLYELAIKETASGEEIHVNDSSNLKLREFALYGKAKQNTTTGKNLLENMATSQTNNGITYTVNEDGSVTVNGTATADSRLYIHTTETILNSGEYIISGCPKGGSDTTYSMGAYCITDGTIRWNLDRGNGTNYVANESFVIRGNNSPCIIIYKGYTANNLVFKPMIRLASITDDTYEPFTNGASPNPQYPQPIEVSGESYNLLENIATSQEKNGVVFTVNEDKSISVSGTASDTSDITINLFKLPIGEYKFTTNGESKDSKSACFVQGVNGNNSWLYGEEVDLNITQESDITCRIYVWSGATVNTTYYPMIRKASVKNDRYMPYGVDRVEVKSVGKNKLDPSKNTIGFIDANGSFSDAENYLLSDFIKTNGKTAISTNSYVGDSYIRVYIYDSKKNFIKRELLSLTPTTLSIIVDNIGYIRVCYDNFEHMRVENVQVEDGSVATPYEPYKETLATIPTENGLAGIKVSSNGNYTDSNGQQWICDEIVKYADGSGKRINNIEKCKLADLSWTYTGNEGERRFVSSNLVGVIKEQKDSNSLPIALCDSYRVLSYADCYGKYTDKTMTVIFESSGLHGQLWIINTDFNNVDDFKNSLGDTLFYYQLKEPIETPLTAEEIAEIENLHTFYPITNISNDFDCGMSVTYYCDSKNYIGNQLAIMKQEQEEAMANMLLLMPTEVQAMMIENDTNDLLKESEI